jgi:Sigma-70, region 4
MNAGRKFRQLEFRERVTDAILETLAQLPEAHRNIFIWSHYLGYGAGKIAEILGWSSPSVETTLVGINSILYQKVRALLAENPQPDREISLAGDVMPLQEAECHPWPVEQTKRIRPSL